MIYKTKYMSLTPKQFNKLATKEDLKNLKEEMASKKDINKILTAVDGLAKNVQDFQAELVSNQMAHDRMQKYIESLEKRIVKIELRTGIRRIK